MPVLKMENRVRYGFASGATDRTSTRIERELPIGTRTIDPRSVADALIWLGASKWGSRRRYEFTLGFRIRQISSAWVRMWSMNSHPKAESFSCPFSSQNRFVLPLEIETLVCMPLPLTPTTGLGRKLAVKPMLLAIWRVSSL